MHQVQFSGTYALGRKNSSKYTFVYKELLITGSEFPLSGFFLAVVCTVRKAVGAEQKKIGAKKFPILHYIMPPVWTIVIDKGNLIFLHNRHIFVICCIA